MIISQDAYRYSDHPCTHNGTWTDYDPATFHYEYMYDCVYFYNWEGMPVVNNRTMVTYATLVYIIIYAIAGTTGICVTLLAVFVILRTKMIKPTSKTYLLAMMLLSLYFNTQFFYHAHCLHGFEPDGVSPPHTYHVWPCLNTDNWPWSALKINMLLTAFWLSGNISYYLLTWLSSFHRFVIVYVPARFTRLASLFPIVGILLSLAVPAGPIYSLIGREPLFLPSDWQNITARENYFGVYFNPKNNYFNGYYMRQHFLWDTGPVLWLLAAPNIWMFLAELSLVRRARDHAINSPTQGYKELNEVKQLLTTHALICVGWLAYTIYAIFSYDLRVRNSVLHWFLFQYTPWFLMSIGNPIVILYYYRPKSEPNHSLHTHTS